MNIRIQQNYRIDIEKVEKLMDIKAVTGTPIVEMVNEALGDYLEKRNIPDSDYVKPDAPTVYDSENPPGSVHTDKVIAETPNKDITAPKYVEVTEGYNPDDKSVEKPKEGGANGLGFTLKV